MTQARLSTGNNPATKTTATPPAEPVPRQSPDKSLENWIWDAACSIRGAKDAGKYKDYILPLIFTKRLCDGRPPASGG